MCVCVLSNSVMGEGKYDPKQHNCLSNLVHVTVMNPPHEEIQAPKSYLTMNSTAPSRSTYCSRRGSGSFLGASTVGPGYKFVYKPQSL